MSGVLTPPKFILWSFCSVYADYIVRFFFFNLYFQYTHWFVFQYRILPILCMIIRRSMNFDILLRNASLLICPRDFWVWFQLVYSLTSLLENCSNSNFSRLWKFGLLPYHFLQNFSWTKNWHFCTFSTTKNNKFRVLQCYVNS